MIFVCVTHRPYSYQLITLKLDEITILKKNIGGVGPVDNTLSTTLKKKLSPQKIYIYIKY